ncbi:hypothetical protein QBC38DRAFT_530371 [Podospora fimiseda]|uniref:F-box domain-containing protein n=1 Tax=Podospora fimiseda TaxID=252190 RepID=A0AAN7GS63_9PEZI|nr:hypothetical protein QBC38DRAFT_530371 [Podospora fimiseda]
MGQNCSLPFCLSRRHKDKPPPTTATEPELAFSKVPVDIILLLCEEHLSDQSALALSLTCKGLRCLIAQYHQTKLKQALINPSDHETFMLLLEKDHGHEVYYCHTCHILHRFLHRSQGPTVYPFESTRLKKCRLNLLNLNFNVSYIIISYRQVRLVMNRHFLDLPNGLPLESFNMRKREDFFQNPNCYWSIILSAKVLQDKLFLCATRTFYLDRGSDQEVRHWLDETTVYICAHVAIGSPQRHLIRALYPLTTTGFVEPCRDAVECCPHCITDYDTTVERRPIDNDEEKGTTACWVITINSYHQLGAGRSPQDPEWRMITNWGMNKTRKYEGLPGLCTYGAGCARRMWKEAVS